MYYPTTPSTKKVNQQKDSRAPESPRNGTNGNRSKEWWQRQVVQRTATTIKGDLQRITSISPFLQSHESRQVAKFDRSEIVTGRVLGRGGFAAVYEIIGFDLDPSISKSLTKEEQSTRQRLARNAVDPRTRRGRYVVKYLRPDVLQRGFREAASDLAVEAAYLSRIEHEHIVSLQGLPVDGVDAWKVGLHDGFFLILDRLTETLDHCLTNKRSTAPPTLQKTEYALQLASALEYLHEEGIIYRDLKPQNIGFDSYGRIRLMDFGLVRELPGGHAQLYEMSGVGTRRYMAPEVIRDGRYNCKADVYCWSMVVWQLFTHCKPYSMYSPADHTHNVCLGGERPPLGEGADIHGDVRASKEVNLFFKRLLTQCWDDSVANRLSMSEVTRKLRRHLARTNGSMFCTESTPEGIEVTLSFDDGIIRIVDDEEEQEEKVVIDLECEKSLGIVLAKKSVPSRNDDHPLLKTVFSGSTCSMSSISLADEIAV